MMENEQEDTEDTEKEWWRRSLVEQPAWFAGYLESVRSYCPGFQLDLSGVAIERVSLDGVDLSGVKLHKAYFFQASLSGAQLLQADLTGAILIETDLTEANFGQSVLSLATFCRCDMERASLRFADCEETSFDECQLFGVDWFGVKNLSEDICQWAIETMARSLGTPVALRAKKPTEAAEKESSSSTAGAEVKFIVDDDSEPVEIRKRRVVEIFLSSSKSQAA